MREEIERIQRLRESLEEGDTSTFDLMLEEVCQEKSRQSVTLLLTVLNDDPDLTDEMYSIVHAVESFPQAEYLEGLLDHVQSAGGFSEYWLELLLMRIMNDLEYFSGLKSRVARRESELLTERLVMLSKDILSKKQTFEDQSFELLAVLGDQ